MLYKNYPSKENKIIYERRINSISNKYLKYLVKGMLDKEKKRIKWNEYFNNPFFKELNKNKKIKKFDIKCKYHLKNLFYYCIDCKCNICDLCIKEHSSHQIIPFSKIGLNDLEINKINSILKDIENNLQYLKIYKNKIKEILNEMKEIKTNKYIYEDNEKNNFKKYYLYYLELIKEKTKINIDLININKEKNKIENYFDYENCINNINSILCEINISKNEINKSTQEIIKFKNEDIKQIYLEDKIIEYNKYKFEKIGKYKIKIIY